MNRVKYFIPYIWMLCLLAACSTTKHLPEGEVLYIGQKATVVDNPTPTDVGLPMWEKRHWKK